MQIEMKENFTWRCQVKKDERKKKPRKNVTVVNFDLVDKNRQSKIIRDLSSIKYIAISHVINFIQSYLSVSEYYRYHNHV